MTQKNKNISIAVLYFLFIFISAFFINNFLNNLPIKYISRSTGECVTVYYKGFYCDCETLNENNLVKFEKVWVK
jgi:hypothetical protein